MVPDKNEKECVVDTEVRHLHSFSRKDLFLQGSVVCRQSPAVISFRVFPFSGQPHVVTEQGLGTKVRCFSPIWFALKGDSCSKLSKDLSEAWLVAA